MAIGKITSKAMEASAAMPPTGGTFTGDVTFQGNINGAYSLPISDGSNGQVLTTDGSGAITFVTPAAGGGADLYAANESSPTAQPSATGANAIAIGDSAVSSGTDSVAIGKSASTNDGIAIGLNASTTALKATAIGANMGGVGALGSGFGSMAFGASRSNGTESFAAVIANNTSSYGASGANSIAMGDRSKATSGHGVAIGKQNIAQGSFYSTSIGGASNTATGAYSAIVGGQTSTASGSNSIIVGGQSNTATNPKSSVLGGQSNTASGTFSTVLGGYLNQATGNYSVTVGGNNNIASGLTTIAMGSSSTASHDESVCIGTSVQSTAINQINLGGTADTVRISETYTLPTTDGTNGQVLTTDGSGAITFVTPASGGSAFTTPEVKTSSWSVTNADKGKVFIVDTDNLTLTLPEDSTLDSDWFIRIYTKGEGFQPSYGQVGDLTIDPQYSLHSGRVNGNTNWTMRSRQGGILFVDPEASNNFLFDTHSTNWDIDVHSTANANRANATGWGGVAISGQATASATGAVAIGYLSSATGNDSIAIGGNSAQAVSSNAIALGKSKASGTDSFAASITNNTSSYGATSTDSIAIGDRAKAGSGGQSVAIGQMSIASGTSACAISGYYAQAQGSGSLALGLYSNAQGNNSVSIGYRSYANTQGKVAIAAGETSGISSGAGHQQRGIYILKGATTDATQKVLTGQGGTASSSNSWKPDANSAHAFSGTIIARQDGTDGDNYAAWEVKGAIMKADNAASMVVGAAIINSLYHTSGASAWAVAIIANTTLGTAEVKVTGAASTNIDWVTTIDTSEVVNP